MLILLTIDQLIFVHSKMASSVLNSRGILISLLLAVVPHCSPRSDFEPRTDSAYTFTLVGVPTETVGSSSLPTLLGANLTLIASSKYDIARLLSVPVNVAKLNSQGTDHIQVRMDFYIRPNNSSLIK